MSDECAIVGVGLTPFGRFESDSLKTLGKRAIDAAMADAGLGRDDLDMVFVANALGSIITGQVAVVGQVVLAEAGIAGIPVFNVDNACAGSASALVLAQHAIRAGAARRVLVVGVEKMYSSERARTYRGLNAAADVDWVASTDVDIERESVFIKHVYPGRLRAYIRDRRALEPEVLARIAVKNRGHAAWNPLAQYREPINVDQVLSARVVAEPLTTLMCAPIGDGASAVVMTDATTARRNQQRPIWIRAAVNSMGTPNSEGSGTIHRLGELAYTMAGVGPQDVDVAELHDATAFNELLAYEELGFCDRGRGPELVRAGETSLGGTLPVNTSGGLESRGHPVAASGLAQVHELVLQLRGEAGARQVPAARIALAEIAGGYVNGDSASVAVTILGRERSLT